MCSTGLSPIESMLYGNRCVWCGEDIPIPSLRNFALKMYYDYRIYKICRKIKAICPDVKYARTLYLGSLGACGFNNYVKVKRVKDRKKVLKELEYVFGRLDK